MGVKLYAPGAQFKNATYEQLLEILEWLEKPAPYRANASYLVRLEHITKWIDDEWVPFGADMNHIDWLIRWLNMFGR